MSLIDIEQNDVDISQLFAYKTEVTLLIPGTTDEVKFYQRIVGDADNNKARVYGLRESADFREQLRNEKWEDRKAYLPNISKLLKEELINIILSLELQDMSLDVMNETTLKHPKEPSGKATLEEQEKYQKEIDEYKIKFNEMISEGLDKRLDSRRKVLGSRKKEDLKEQYEATVINRLCQERFGRAYLAMATYYATYTDSSFQTRAFKTFEDFNNTPSNLKEALIDSYSELQIGGTTLKKSQGAMP